MWWLRSCYRIWSRSDCSCSIWKIFLISLWTSTVCMWNCVIIGRGRFWSEFWVCLPGKPWVYSEGVQLHICRCVITVDFFVVGQRHYHICSRNLRTFFSILAAEKSGCVKYADFFCGCLDRACLIIIIIIIINIIIIIIINCNWVLTRWQWLFYMYTNMKIK